jgi:putative peptide modification system cyclase
VDEVSDNLQSSQFRTLVLTDLCDSVALVEHIGDNAAADLFRALDAQALQLLSRWNGRLIDRSDGMFLLFDAPVDGLGFALDYLEELDRLGKKMKLPLRARVGMHVGYVLSWQNSEEAVAAGAKSLEVEGLAKPMAARLMALARPGQILLSAAAESMMRSAQRKLGDRGAGLKWKSHGHWHFKGMPTAQEVFEVGEEGRAPLRMPKRSTKAWRELPLWRRPAALAVEVALVAALAVIAWTMVRPEPAIAFAERDWVVVGDIRNLTDDPDMEDSMGQAFRISIEQSRFVNVLSDLKVQQTLSLMHVGVGTPVDRALGIQVALRDGARALILPTLSTVNGRMQISVEVIDPGTGATVYTESSQASIGSGNALLEMVDATTRRLRGRLGETVASISSSDPLPKVATRDLDALRAFALAEKASGNRDYEQSRRFYKAALEADPDFALAHVGLARLLARTNAREEAMTHIQRATALREALPARERLYLDAWLEELSPRGWATENWVTLAKLYPDFFAGPANASWYLLMANRFEEAKPYAIAAAAPQDPMRVFPMVHLARIQLAQGEYKGALDTFLASENLANGSVNDARADVLMAMGRLEEAEAVLAQALPQRESVARLTALRGQLLLAVERGQFDDAQAMAAALVKEVATYPADYRNHFALLALSVRLLNEPARMKLADFSSLLPAFESAITPRDPALRDNYYRLLSLAYLMQRSGYHELSGRVIGRHRVAIQTLDNPVLETWLQVVLAQQLAAEGDHDGAISQILPLLEGGEPVQARVVLREAFRAKGDQKEVSIQDSWLLEHRGQAFAEVAASQVMQVLNVADTRRYARVPAP